MLRKRGIPHQVLNAKFHELEAQIIAQAGKRNAVTIATNMAGRGTDIVLGAGDEEENKFVKSIQNADQIALIEDKEIRELQDFIFQCKMN